MELWKFIRRNCCTFCDAFIVVIRLFGVCTAIVLFGVGVDVTVYHHNAGIYIIIGALLVFFFETFWVIVVFLRVCLPNHSIHSWIDVMSLWTWPKAIFYCFGGCLLILYPQRLWLSTVAGAMLLIVVVLNVIRALVDCRVNQGILVPTSDEDFIRCEYASQDTKDLSASDGDEI